MKITKSTLMQIIQEEAATILEQGQSLASGPADRSLPQDYSPEEEKTAEEDIAEHMQEVRLITDQLVPEEKLEDPVLAIWDTAEWYQKCRCKEISEQYQEMRREAIAETLRDVE